MCAVLVWFLIKPYSVTREARHLGLPLGFAFLGISHILSACVHVYSTFSLNSFTWFEVLSRPFAFAFLAFTYYFSKKPSKNTRLIWDITLSVIIVALTSMFILFFVVPEFALSSFQILFFYTRAFDIVCLLYIIIHTLRRHLSAQDSKTILTPFGYIFLGISQYSFLIWAVDRSQFAFYGGLAIRWIGLVLFLLIAYRTFYGSQKGSPK
jgi:hypothetical protein